MKSIIMAGGKGSRIGGEKALLKIGNITLLERVVEALQETDILVAVTDATKKTKKKARELGLRAIMTPGNGYHEDLMFLSKRFKEFLSVCVDLPFLSRELVYDVIKKYNEIRRAICVVISKEDYKELGFSPSYLLDSPSAFGLVPVGLNIVAEGEDYFYKIKGKEAININFRDELKEAEKWI